VINEWFYIIVTLFGSDELLMRLE